MATDDTCCTIAPYFNVHDGKLDAFRALCERFVDTTRTEEKMPLLRIQLCWK